MAAFTLPHSNAVPDPPQTTVPWIKNAFYWDFHSPKMTKTHIKNVRGADQKRPNFCFRYFPQISTLLEIPRETPWKIAENRTLKWGSSPPPSTWIKSIQVLSGLYLDTYDNTSFYVKKRNTLIFSIFLVVTTTKSHNRVKSCHSQRGPFCPFCASPLVDWKA